MTTSAEEEVQFLIRLQRLLNEGSFVATYKYALLMSLADISIEREDSNENGELVVSVREIAEKFIFYYWRQILPYPTEGEETVVFRQNTGKQAGIVRRLEEARLTHGSLAVMMREPAAWRSLVGEVASVVRVMPLWKLQTVGGSQLEFLYDNVGKGSSVTLKPGVSHCLRKFHALVTDLVRAAWTRYVRRQNLNVLNDAADLQEFLFGSDRNSLAKVRPILLEAQEGRCFYCGRTVKPENVDVDHFVPWSLYPVDLGHNFVIAHKTCNNSKSDRLAAADHLAHWQEFQDDHGNLLADSFNDSDVLHDLAKSRQITRWAYASTLQVGGLTWRKKDDLVPLPEDLMNRMTAMPANSDN